MGISKLSVLLYIPYICIYKYEPNANHNMLVNTDTKAEALLLCSQSIPLVPK